MFIELLITSSMETAVFLVTILLAPKCQCNHSKSHKCQCPRIWAWVLDLKARRGAQLGLILKSCFRAQCEHPIASQVWVRLQLLWNTSKTSLTPPTRAWWSTPNRLDPRQQNAFRIIQKFFDRCRRLAWHPCEALLKISKRSKFKSPCNSSDYINCYSGRGLTRLENSVALRKYGLTGRDRTSSHLKWSRSKDSTNSGRQSLSTPSASGKRGLKTRTHSDLVSFNWRTNSWPRKKRHQIHWCATTTKSLSNLLTSRTTSRTSKKDKGFSGRNKREKRNY